MAFHGNSLAFNSVVRSSDYYDIYDFLTVGGRRDHEHPSFCRLERRIEPYLSGRGGREESKT